MKLISAFFVVIKEIIKVLLKIFIPIFIVVTILVIIKIIYRYKKYGKREFDVFRKHNNTKFSDIVIDIIKKIDSNAYYLEKDNLYSDIVLINSTGIYLLKIMNYKGLITGTRNEKIMKNKVKRNIELDLENPFYYIEEDKNKILNIDNTLIIHTLLITSNTVNVNIDSVSKEEVISLQNLYYSMENYLKNNQIYDEKYISEIKNKVSII